jgi:hypothetical protein
MKNQQHTGSREHPHAHIQMPARRPYGASLKTGIGSWQKRATGLEYIMPSHGFPSVSRRPVLAVQITLNDFFIMARPGACFFSSPL